MNEQHQMAVRRITTSAPTTKATRKDGIEVSAEHTPKRAVATKTTTKRATALSEAAIMLNDLRPSVDALHDRVEKLRLRFA